MSITVEWDNAEKTILHFTFKSRWSREEFFEVVEVSNRMVDQIDHDIGVIIDMRDSGFLPSSLMPDLRSMSARSHARMRKIVLVTNNRFITNFIHAFSKLYPSPPQRRFLMVETLDQARGFLSGDRE
jgi:hypothetical protein